MILTKKTICGITVLAKQTKYGLSIMTYANSSQAEQKEAELKNLGINCYIMAGHPKLIRIID